MCGGDDDEHFDLVECEYSNQASHCANQSFCLLYVGVNSFSCVIMCILCVCVIVDVLLNGYDIDAVNINHLINFN